MKKLTALLLAVLLVFSAAAFAAAEPADSIQEPAADPQPSAPVLTEDAVSEEPAVYAQPLYGSLYQVVVTNAQDASRVQIPTWSELNGQDDLVWYDAVRNTDGSWSFVVNTANHGGRVMISHAYADGQFAGAVTYTASVPDHPGVLLIPRISSVYTLLISNVPDADSVKVPVWTTDLKQEDISWYDAHNDGNGIWSVQFNAARHAGGSMTCHIYGDDKLLGSAVFSLPQTVPAVRTELLNGTRYRVVIENLWGAQNVQVPTWGIRKGQDDIIWYTAYQAAPGTWHADINAAIHDEGTVDSHIYADGRCVNASAQASRSYLTIQAGGSQSATPNLALSRTFTPWGPGGPTDAHGRSLSAMQYNDKYGKYDADFIGPDENKIYLTFDEGYENGYTGKILDVLKAKNVKAVFFVTHYYVKTNPDLIRRMIDEGHQVGSHSMSHPSFPKISTEQAIEEVVQLHRILQSQFGYNMTLFRFPAGEFCERDLALLQALGYRSVFWSHAYKDWDPALQIGYSAALQTVTKGMHPGAIYLLHAVSKDNANILGDFIDRCRQRGYTLAPYDIV